MTERQEDIIRGIIDGRDMISASFLLPERCGRNRAVSDSCRSVPGTIVLSDVNVGNATLGAKVAIQVVGCFIGFETLDHNSQLIPFGPVVGRPQSEIWVDEVGNVRIDKGSSWTNCHVISGATMRLMASRITAGYHRHCVCYCYWFLA